MTHHYQHHYHRQSRKSHHYQNRIHQIHLMGFTLLEILVAISLLSMVALLSWRGLSSMIQANTQITSQTQQLQQLNTLWSQLQIDLNHTPPVGLFQSSTASIYVDESGGLHIIRTTAASSSAGQDLIHIRYGLAGPAPQHTLQRELINTSPTNDTRTTTTPIHRVAVVHALTGWELQAWYANSTQWDNTLPSISDITRSPKAIAINLMLSPRTATQPAIVIRKILWIGHT
jgi:general secretion pathway protein J